MNLCKMVKEGSVVFVPIKERDINKRSPIVLMCPKKEEKAQGARRDRQRKTAR